MGGEEPGKLLALMVRDILSKCMLRALVTLAQLLIPSAPTTDPGSACITFSREQSAELHGFLLSCQKSMANGPERAKRRCTEGHEATALEPSIALRVLDRPFQVLDWKEINVEVGFIIQLAFGWPGGRPCRPLWHWHCILWQPVRCPA